MSPPEDQSTPEPSRAAGATPLSAELLESAGLDFAHASLASPPPFFIIAAPRSGSTLLRVLLDSHPDLSVGPETNVLHHWFDAVDHSKTLALYPFAAEGMHRYPAAALELLQRRYAHDRGKRRWGDKTPAYSDIIDRLAECWSGAQFVHCYRDGRDVACSMRDRWGWSVRAAARAWNAKVTKILHSDVAGTDQYYEVRYEELVEDVEGVMRGVLAFLGERWHEDVLSHERRPHDGVVDDVPEARRPVYTSSIGRWREELNPWERWWARYHAGVTLERLGYPAR